LLFELQKNGVQISPILHGAGLSSTGDPALDRRFPLDEFYDIPKETLEKIQLAKKHSRRVIAVGTTVTRALETAFQNSRPTASKGRTALRLGSSSHLKVVDGLLTGMHEIGTSHAELMLAFSSRGSKMLYAIDQETRDYHSHEYGDLMLLLRQSAPGPRYYLRWLF
jgi:S-adenosylmethionine:tRNA ribosyltransferase-isomerase